MVVRRLVLATAGLLLITGCVGGGDEPSAKPSATESSTSAAPPARTVDQLAAALPRSSQVPTATKKLRACPGEDYCTADSVSVGFELTPPVSEAALEKLAAESIFSDDADVTAKLTTGAGGGTTAVEDGRATAGQYQGSYAIEATDVTESTYTFGEKGEGTIDDITVAGWTGYIIRRQQVLTNPEGNVESPTLDRTDIHVTDGVTTLRVIVTLRPDQRAAGASEEIARQLATEYIARLG